MRTAIHRMIEQCRSGEYPALAAKMNSGWLILAERQVLPGYCLLLADPVVSDLNALPVKTRVQFLTDMASAGDALIVLTGAVRINYAIFGNVGTALHAHLFPRRADEPEADRTLQPWALNWDEALSFSVAVHGEFKNRLAVEIARLRPNY